MVGEFGSGPAGGSSDEDDAHVRPVPSPSDIAERLAGRIRSGAADHIGRTYLDGVRDTIAAAADLIRDLEGHVPPGITGELPSQEEALPFDRAARRIAADLRLTAAELSRLLRRVEEQPPSSVRARSSEIMDAVGLLIVAAHLVERPTSSNPHRAGTGRQRDGASGGFGDRSAMATWLAAFVVGVVMDHEPTEHDTEELLRLAGRDRAALDAALRKVAEIDDLAAPVRSAALDMLESGLSHLG